MPLRFLTPTLLVRPVVPYRVTEHDETILSHTLRLRFAFQNNCTVDTTIYIRARIHIYARVMFGGFSGTRKI